MSSNNTMPVFMLRTLSGMLLGIECGLIAAACYAIVREINVRLCKVNILSGGSCNHYGVARLDRHNLDGLVGTSTADS